MFSVQASPETPQSFWDATAIPRNRMTRHPPYRSDNLSRLTPPSELIKRHSPCGIRSLAEGRTLGAHFAGRLAYILSLSSLGCWLRIVAPTSSRGAGSKDSPGASAAMMFGAYPGFLSPKSILLLT